MVALIHQPRIAVAKPARRIGRNLAYRALRLSCSASTSPLSLANVGSSKRAFSPKESDTCEVERLTRPLPWRSSVERGGSMSEREVKKEEKGEAHGHYLIA